MQRIHTIVGFVKDVQVVADIGCDHGQIAKLLLEQGSAKKVIACDISKPSLEKAKKLAAEAGLALCMETRLGDGLSVLEEAEVDAIVIAGMGGMLIRQILDREPRKAKSAGWLVLSPHRNVLELRKYLAENGYRIEAETLVLEDGRYYPVICAVPGHAAAEQDEFFYGVGRKLIEGKDRHLPGFLKREIAKADKILKSAAQSRNASQYLQEVALRKTKLEEVLEDVERR